MNNVIIWCYDYPIFETSHSQLLATKINHSPLCPEILA